MVPITITFETTQMGRFSDRNFLALLQEKGQWLGKWSLSAILRDLEPKGRGVTGSSCTGRDAGPTSPCPP